jgi:hypothetical protein
MVQSNVATEMHHETSFHFLIVSLKGCCRASAGTAEAASYVLPGDGAALNMMRHRNSAEPKPISFANDIESL